MPFAGDLACFDAPITLDDDTALEDDDTFFFLACTLGVDLVGGGANILVGVLLRRFFSLGGLRVVDCVDDGVDGRRPADCFRVDDCVDDGMDGRRTADCVATPIKLKRLARGAFC